MTTPVPESSGVAHLAVRGTLWLSLGNYVNLFIGFGATLLLARILSPEVFGFFSMAFFWSTILSLRSKAGANYAAIRHAGMDGTLLGTFLVVEVSLALGSVALGVLASQLLPLAGYPADIVWPMVTLIALELVAALGSPLSVTIERELQFGRVILLTLLSYGVGYAAALILALRGAGVWSLVSVNIIATVIATSGVYWICRRHVPIVFGSRWRFDRVLARHLLRAGLPTGLSVTASGIAGQFDNFLIGTFVGYNTLGFYDRAYRMGNWTNILLATIVNRVAFVTYSRVREDLPRLVHAVRLSYWLLSTLGVPITLVILFGAPDLIGIIYGPAWADSAAFLPALAAYALATPFIGVGVWLTVSLGHARMTLWLTAAQIATLVILATPLTLRWGATGTIVGVGMTSAVGTALSCRYVLKQLHLSVREIFGVPLLSTGAAAAMLTALPHLVDDQGWQPLARLFVIGIVGPGIYLLMTLALSRSETTRYIRYLVHRWRQA